MKKEKLTRRRFITSTSAGAAAAMLSAPLFANTKTGASKDLALLGGQPVRSKEWRDWPVWNKDAETPMMELLRSGNWFRGEAGKCREFEKAYGELIGAKRVLATASGTTALLIALHTLGVDAGDEVIISPYTFIATYNVVFNQKALPVFADTAPDSFNMCAEGVEKVLSDKTAAIVVGHIAGEPADIDPASLVQARQVLKDQRPALRIGAADQLPLRFVVGDHPLRHRGHAARGQGLAVDPDLGRGVGGDVEIRAVLLDHALEQRIEGLAGQHVDLVDDEHPELFSSRVETQHLTELANILYLAVGRAVDLHHIEIRPPRPDAPTRLTVSAGLTECLAVRRPLAVQRHGEDPGGTRLSDAAWPRQQIGVRNPIARYRALEPGRHVGLGNEVKEALGPVLPGESEIGHRDESE